MDRKSKVALALIAIIIIAVIATSFGGMPLPFAEIGYLTGTQGMQAGFHGICFQGAYFCQSETPRGWKPGASSFGFSMDFDPDDASSGWCDICAAQQPMTLDRDVEPKHYQWIVDKGIVTLPNGTKVKKVIQFEMWRYRLTWSINLWLSGTEDEMCDTTYFNIITWEPNYAGSQIWIRLVPKAFVYFKENPDEVYFAPAYIGCSGVTFSTYDKNKQQIVNDPDAYSLVDIIPKATGETIGIYYQRGGTPVNLEDKLLSYQGATLDPAIFRKEYWTKIDIMQFKPKNWYDWQLWHGWKCPSVKLDFVVYMFVVGKWTVYLSTDEVPQLQPHIPLVQPTPWNDFLTALGSWLSNPLVQFWLIIIVIVIVLIFAGPTIVALVSASRKGGGNSKS